MIILFKTEEPINTTTTARIFKWCRLENHVLRNIQRIWEPKSDLEVY